MENFESFHSAGCEEFAQKTVESVKILGGQLEGN